MAERPFALVSCEHGGNTVPVWIEARFRKAQAALRSHRGWDPGALELARQLAGAIRAPLHFSAVSRLVVDLNRSPGSASLFSEFTRELPEYEREEILAEHYRPYRRRVQRDLAEGMLRSQVAVHLSIHSFTPVLEGQKRDVDVGVLFDPGREKEAAFAARWVEELSKTLPEARVRANQPYVGTDDGLTTALRAHFPPNRYLGLELEVTQAWPQSATEAWVKRRDAIVRATEAALAGFSEGRRDFKPAAR